MLARPSLMAPLFDPRESPESTNALGTTAPRAQRSPHRPWKTSLSRARGQTTLRVGHPPQPPRRVPIPHAWPPHDAGRLRHWHRPSGAGPDKRRRTGARTIHGSSRRSPRAPSAMRSRARVTAASSSRSRNSSLRRLRSSAIRMGRISRKRVTSRVASDDMVSSQRSGSRQARPSSGRPPNSVAQSRPPWGTSPREGPRMGRME